MEKTIGAPELDVIDLGAASIETKGPPGGVSEAEGRIFLEGISDA
jgi:hypothetical protein